MNRIKIAASILLASFSQLTFAQTAPPADLVTIEQNFKKLDVLGSVLYVAAHPDDENTRLLAYLAQEKHYRTGYLSLTRGDGGQNLLGSEQGELLGLIRTQELLAARKVDGAEQFFTRANDFGFSKGPDETLKIWDREKVLGDVVWVIRKFRPDVIICRFPTTGEGGHGHHTSSAILAQEAFAAAADPKRFPEQLQYVKTWQAKRLLWNTFNFGTTNTIRPGQFKVDVGVYNPIIGKGYGELAAESRSNHKTQGFGSARQRGEAPEFFKTILGDAPQNDLLDGVDATWSRIKGGEAIAAEISTIRKNFDVDHPEKSVPALVKLLDQVEKVQNAYWRAQKVKELDNLIAACAGLWFESYTVESTYALGDSIAVYSQVLDRYSDKVKLNSISINGIAKSYNSAIAANQLQSYSINTFAAKITQPYWLQTPHTQGTYNIPDQLSVGNPETQGLLTADFEFTIEGKLIHFERRLVYKFVDPVRGEVYQLLTIAPPVTANVESKDYIFNSTIPQTIQIKLKSFTKASGSISLKPMAGWKVVPEKFDFSNKNKGDEWTVAFTVTPADNQPKTTTLEAVVNVNGQSFSLGILNIKYDHVPNITLFLPAQAKLIDVDLKIAGKKIGYIQGAGDLVPDALKQVGYDVHQLSENEILNGDLSGYDAIITGVRAWNVNERLAVEQPKLMEYVKNGGNLLVQYNNNAGIVTKQIGPYPLRVVNQRVTDEDAKVTILDQQSPVLNYPNKISQDDFNGWIQERGLYFVSDIDPQYKTVLQMNDPGEAPNNGSLVVGNYGEGRFIYTSLAFFRQLPAGVPGAYRLFINLLSKPKNQPLN
ncbi:LmbE family N-acetylglucosaminyl deacetylase [Mucilaginibacter frigoritolerans]|uniref:LmbE family N-acetylglucosaminyl deacetylase n=1 Tax=Mucilaginibacter frigoritolerans TaxID=652788 RepID=A0A562UBW2_9SPHI|nr:PIG-L family deacetylase [Mucilaginibacter frigoritolerans]TWJ03284.1 LmbE family N-acetylglucosaminyl deacetylase [Mucilaginibacter frigoritolerans]